MAMLQHLEMKEHNCDEESGKGFSSLPTSSFIIAATLFLIVLAVFSDVLKADFVMWDDDINISTMASEGRLDLKLVIKTLTHLDSMSRFGPINSLLQRINYHFFGRNPFGYHMINWLFHGLNSVMLFLIIRTILLKSTSRKQNITSESNGQINIAASIAALIWAIHPLRVEPVAWAATQGHDLAVLFLLFSVFFYINAVNSEADRMRYLILLAAALSLYTLSVFTFATGITFFLVYFVLDIVLFRRAAANPGWLRSMSARKVLLEKLIFALPAISVAVLSVIVRFKSAGVWQPAIPSESFGIMDRAMQAIYIVVYYLYRPFYPVGLAPFYTTLLSFDPLSPPFLLRAFIFIMISAIVFVFRKRWPIIAALWLCHIILLVPVMGFFERPHYHVDRYSLIPSICLSILIAFGLITVMARKYYSMSLVSSSLIVICILVWLSFNQIKIWHNSEALFSHTIETLGNDPYRQDIYRRLGQYLLETGERDRARMNFYKTLEINPNHPIAHWYLAQIEFQNNNLTRSAYHLRKFLAVNPNDKEAESILLQISDKINRERYLK